MDTEINMDDIDFWELIDKTNFEHEMTNAVTLRMSPCQEEQPQSNISTLPSEDEEMYVDINAYNNMTTITRIDPVENSDAAGYFGFERRAPLEVVATSETAVALNNSREKWTPEQDKLQHKQESKKEKNRQSAKRSREKKKVEMEELQKRNTTLQEKHNALVLQVGEYLLTEKLLKLYVKELSCCVQETGEDPYEQTGIMSKVSWTKEDEEIVDDILKEMPGLSLKTPILHEVNESPPTAFQEETKYMYEPEGYVAVPHFYEDVEQGCMGGEYNVNSSIVNDKSEEFSPKFYQGSYMFSN